MKPEGIPPDDGDLPAGTPSDPSEAVVEPTPAEIAPLEEFTGVSLSKSAVQHLCKMKSLRSLALWSTGLSPTPIETVANASPNCQLHTD